MAILDTHYQCGCGFKTTEPLKALDHCNATGHQLTVQGFIRPGTPRPTNAAPSRSTVSSEPTESSQAKLLSDLEQIRQKLTRK